MRADSQVEIGIFTFVRKWIIDPIAIFYTVY